MKRIIAILLALILCFSLVACGGGGEDGSGGDADDNSQKAALIVQVGGLGDEGFNDSSKAGMDRAKAELGVDFVVVEPVEAAETETYLRELGEAGYGLVICMEYGALAFTPEVAADYPDTVYMQFGGEAVEGLDNYVGTQGEAWDSSYLGGTVAAFLATDGNEIVDGVGAQPGAKIGIVFGLESAGFYMYEDAFKQGVKEYNPDAEVIVDYNGGFTDTQNVKTITENMINNLGCDVVWLCCGTAGLGGLQACRLNNAFAIGVDVDQDGLEPGFVATSIKYTLDNCLFNVVEMWQNNTLRGKGQIRLTLANDEVGITDMSVIAQYVTNEEKFQELQDLVAEKKQGILDGSIVVHSVVDLGGARYDF